MTCAVVVDVVVPGPPGPQGPQGVPGPAAAPPAYHGPWSATVGTTSGVLVAAGAYSTAFTIQTLPGSTGNIYLRPDGSAAVVQTGILIFAGGGSWTFGSLSNPLPTGNLTAITD